MDLLENYELVMNSKYFDAAWYLKNYADVRKAGLNPLMHYMEIGWREGRKPGPYFSSRYYLFDNSDVQSTDMNPLLHYEKYGVKEGRINKYEIIKRQKYIDETWYKKTYSDIDYTNIDPTEHYLLFGWKEGLNPSKEHSTKDYFIANPDVAALDICPFIYHEFEINKVLRSIDHIVVHHWGVFEYGNSKFLVFTSVQNDLKIRWGNKVIETVTIENHEPVDCFAEYVMDSYSENAFFYDVSNIPIKVGDKFEVVCDYYDKIEIRILFIWSCFSNSFLLDRNFFYYKKNYLEVTTKKQFAWRVLINREKGSVKNLLKCITADHKDNIILFSEYRNITNDNSWALFCKSLHQNENSFFVTSASRYHKEKDEYIKKHLLIYNSKEHIEKLLHAKTICCSWTLSDIVPTELKHAFYLYPFLNYKWYYCPHGISYDKNSNFLTPIFLGYPQKVFCSSELEKDYFENRCGLKNVHVLGYPRMDKWEQPDGNDILFDFTYRKQYNDQYFLIIKDAVSTIRKTYPKRKVYYLFHPAITKPVQNKIKRMINDKGVSYASAADEAKFNAWFNKAKYLITDYSSVAYDFVYRNNAFAIYYLPKDFTEGHYTLNFKFYNNHLGILAFNKGELLQALTSTQLPQEIKYRRSKFFSFLDQNNCDRVLTSIMEDEHV